MNGLIGLKSDRMSINDGLFGELGQLGLDFEALTLKMSIGTQENEDLGREIGGLGVWVKRERMEAGKLWGRVLEEMRENDDLRWCIEELKARTEGVEEEVERRSVEVFRRSVEPMD
jgi:hypothetical protein